MVALAKGYKGYKDGLQPKTLADGNWLVKHYQPMSKIETKSDTSLRSLYEVWLHWPRGLWGARLRAGADDG